MTEGFPECIPNVLGAYGLWAVLLLGIVAVAFIFLRVEIQNWVAGWKKLRKKDADEVFTRLEVDEVTRDYLKKVIEDYRYFKFRGLDTRSRGIDTPELDQAYITIQMVPEVERQTVHDSREDPDEIKVDSVEAFELHGHTAVHKAIGV